MHGYCECFANQRGGARTIQAQQEHNTTLNDTNLTQTRLEATQKAKTPKRLMARGSHYLKRLP